MKITKTISIAGRLDICSFATLARAYEDEGMRMRSKSDILWQAVEQLSAAYCEKHKNEPFIDIREAVEYMDSIGIPLETNLRVLREITSAKIYQDAGEDYGVDSLYEQASATARRKNRRKKLARLGNIGSVDVSNNDREMHKLASDEMRAMGLSPISFEEFMENKRQKQASEGERVALSNVVDPVAYEEKERLRKEEEKIATSPEALLSAMKATSDIKKEG